MGHNGIFLFRLPCFHILTPLGSKGEGEGRVIGVYSALILISQSWYMLTEQPLPLHPPEDLGVLQILSLPSIIFDLDSPNRDDILSCCHRGFTIGSWQVDSLCRAAFVSVDGSHGQVPLGQLQMNILLHDNSDWEYRKHKLWENRPFAMQSPLVDDPLSRQLTIAFGL